MKKLLMIAMAVSSLLSLYSCGTFGYLENHGKREICLNAVPKDLIVTSGGKILDVHTSVYKSKTRLSFIGRTKTTTSTSGPAVTVARKNRARLEFYCPSTNLRDTLELIPKMNWGIFAGDWFLSAAFGFLVDIPLGNLKEVYPRYYTPKVWTKEMWDNYYKHRFDHH